MSTNRQLLAAPATRKLAQVQRSGSVQPGERVQRRDAATDPAPWFDFEKLIIVPQSRPEQAFAAARRSSGSELPYRSQMEAAFGESFSSVRAFVGRSSLLAPLDAEAATDGQDVLFADKHPSQETVAHEVAHVVQRRQLGSGRPGETSRPSDRSEKEADHLARQIYAGRRLRVTAAPTAAISLKGKDAGALVDGHTSWYGNLDEERLGRELAACARRGDYAIVLQTLDKLGSTDRDDVSLTFMEALSKPELAKIGQTDNGRELLDRVFDELTQGNVAPEEQSQADRILALRKGRIGTDQFEKAALSGRIKIFPHRYMGLTVLHPAPIKAERRDNRRIWVQIPAYTYVDSEYQEDTRTLPPIVATSGIVLPEDELIGVRLQDLGGQLVYGPALLLLQVANQTTTKTLEKSAEVAALGLSLGAGALVGAGAEAGLAARVVAAADRAAFYIGALTSVIGEHRGWIIKRFGGAGTTLLRFIDLVNGAVASYGFGRVVLSLPKLIYGFVQAYRNWRAVVRAAEAELSSNQNAAIRQINQETEQLLGKVDEIKANSAGGREPHAGAGQPPQVEALPAEAAAATKKPLVKKTQLRPDKEKAGLFEALNPEEELENLSLMDDDVQELKDGTKVLRTEISGPSGAGGEIERGYNAESKTLSFRSVQFDESLDRQIKAGKHLVEGTGTPTQAYLTLRQLKLLKGGRDLKHVQVEEITNIQAVLEYYEGIKVKGLSEHEALLNTQFGQYAQTVVNQLGKRLVNGRIIKEGTTTRLEELLAVWGDGRSYSAEKIKALLEAFHVTEATTVQWKFYVEFDLAPLAK